MFFVYCFSEHRLLFFTELIFFIPVHTNLRGSQIFIKDTETIEFNAARAA